MMLQTSGKTEITRPDRNENQTDDQSNGKADDMVDDATDGVNDVVDGVTDGVDDLTRGATDAVDDAADGLTEDRGTQQRSRGSVLEERSKSAAEMILQHFLSGKGRMGIEIQTLY